jgi:hypothetical protein
MVESELTAKLGVIGPLPPELILLAANGVSAVADDGFSANQPGNQETVTGKSDGTDRALKSCHD